MQKYIYKYLSFEGRFGRKQYIFRNLFLCFLEVVAVYVTGFAAVLKNDATAALIYLVLAIIFIFIAIALIASTVRRWHDLNKSTASGVIIGLLPTFISIALITNNGGFVPVLAVIRLISEVYLLLQKGTTGYNDYGPDPLQATEPVASQPIYNNRPAGYVKKVQKVYGIASVASHPQQPTSATSQSRHQLATTVAAPQQQSRINFNDLWELKKLLDEGVITQEEFTAAKKKILN